MIRPLFLPVVALLVLPSALASAQTPFQGSAPPPPAAAPVAPVAQMPVPDSVVDQAREQAAGKWGGMSRARAPGQVQRTWDKALTSDAVHVYELCGDCAYKVRTREFMVTVIELPRGEVIEAVDLGDNSGFSVRPRGDRRLAVRPSGYGFDTSMIVYGKSGAVYPVYLRAEGITSPHTPDLVVRIEGAVSLSDDPALPGISSGDRGRVKDEGRAAKAEVASLSDAIMHDLHHPDPGRKAGDFVQEAPFDPDALRGWGDYTLWGSDELRPETVFRDDHFTYIRFGKRWRDIELPTAYVVVDGIDELVNTRVVGSTFIVESTRPLITLKSGASYLCIEYGGER